MLCYDVGFEINQWNGLQDADIQLINGIILLGYKGLA